MNATISKKKSITRAASPTVLPRARCGVCQTPRSWPAALPGSAKRFFCMTCERNTLHAKINEP